jgi:hypothetical protein
MMMKKNFSLIIIVMLILFLSSLTYKDGKLSKLFFEKYLAEIFQQRSKFKFTKIPGSKFITECDDNADTSLPEQQIFGTYYLSEKSITNRQFCLFLNAVDPLGISLDHIKSENAVYLPQAGFENQAFITSNDSLARMFINWVNDESQKKVEKDSIVYDSYFSKYRFPSVGELENAIKTDRYPSVNSENYFLLDQALITGKKKHILLSRVYLGKSSGFEF